MMLLLTTMEVKIKARGTQLAYLRHSFHHSLSQIGHSFPYKYHSLNSPIYPALILYNKFTTITS